MKRTGFPGNAIRLSVAMLSGLFLMTTTACGIVGPSAKEVSCDIGAIKWLGTCTDLERAEAGGWKCREVRIERRVSTVDQVIFECTK